MLQATLIGHLGAAAEIVRANGQEFIKFRVADSRRWKSADGQVHNETNWVDVTLNDATSPIFPYLKVGTQVFVIGSLSTRVYSSAKDRCMKCGVTIRAARVELLGAAPDIVPKTLYDDNGAAHEVSKFFWTQGVVSSTLRDVRANVYNVDTQGFITPAPENLVEQSQTISPDDNQ